MLIIIIITILIIIIIITTIIAILCIKHLRVTPVNKRKAVKRRKLQTSQQFTDLF